MIDHFQDFLIGLEDNYITGYKEALAWDTEEGASADSVEEHFQMADLTPAGVLGWMTGQQHKPINGDKLEVTVLFDHHCLERNPKHTVCFPVVRACSKEITLPVCHMKKVEDFKEVFLIACTKGQSFANHRVICQKA